MRLPARAADRLAVWGYGAGWAVVRRAPEPVARWCFQRAADLLVRRNPAGVQQLAKNLSRVLADGSGVLDEQRLALQVRDGVRSYARYWLETFRLPAMDVDAVLANTDTSGVQRLDAALALGKGVVLALPHSGNWEVAGLWLVRHGHPFATVAERLKPEALYEKFLAYREQLGMQVLPLTANSGSPMRSLLQRLRAGGVVCLVADRDLSGRGVPVTFFGEAARMPSGPAQLALATGATLFPVHTSYRGRGWRQWIGEPIDLAQLQRDSAASTGSNRAAHRAAVSTATQLLATAFEDRIRRYPCDWHMLQPFWSDDFTLPAEKTDRTDS